MGWIRELGRRVLVLFRRRQFRTGVNRGIRSHPEMRERERMERGVSPQEAQYSVQQRFGNDLVLREECRDMWGWNWLENLVKDLQYGLRQMRRSPGFTATVVLIIALGTGATSAIFSVV